MTRPSLCLWLVLTACAGGAPAPTSTTTLLLPPAPEQRPQEGAPALATWNGGGLTASDVSDELSRQPAGTAPREVAEALVDLDVVVAAAAREGYWSAERLEIPWTRLLVKAFLRDRFELDYDASRVPEADLKRAWDEMKEVRIQFDHYDAIEVADVQYLCCAKRHTECDAAATRACIEASRPTVDALYERYFAGREHNEFSFKYLAEQVLQPTDRHVAFMRYSFYYDPASSWEDQKKFHQYNRNIVETSAVTPVHAITRPVASNNGLHILYVIKHDPGVHLDLSAPEVQATVREKALPGYRQRDLAILMGDLMLKASLKVHDATAGAIPLGFGR